MPFWGRERGGDRDFLCLGLIIQAVCKDGRTGEAAFSSPRRKGGGHIPPTMWEEHRAALRVEKGRHRAHVVDQ